MSAAKQMYLIHCLDDLSGDMVEPTLDGAGGLRFGGSAKRMGPYDDHKSYQGATSNPDSPNFIQKIAAGPLESEDGKYMIGSSFIVYGTYDEALAFNRNDPFYAAGVWERVSINKWISIPNGIKAVKMVMDGDDRTTIRMEPQF